MKVIFIALTSYQLYISSVYALYIKEKDLANNISIISVGIPNYFLFDNDNIEFFYIDDLNKSYIKRVWQRLYWGGRLFNFCPLKKVISGNNNQIFIYNDNEPVTAKIIKEVKKYENSKVTIIEEGIGIYSTTEVSKRGSVFRKLITMILGSPMQYKAIGDNSYIDNVICGNTALYESLSKARGKRILYQNKEQIFRYKHEKLKSIVQDKTHINYHPDIMILGQPFSPFGELTGAEKEYYDKLISLIPKDFQIMIKPHPRDAVGKYEQYVSDRCFVISNEQALLPIEVIVKYFEINYVISFNSSAGINIAACSPKTKCIFTFKTDIGKELFKIWDSGYSKYDDSIFMSKNNNTFFPVTTDEMRSMLLTKGFVSAEFENHNIDNNFSFEEIDQVLKNIF